MEWNGAFSYGSGYDSPVHGGDKCMAAAKEVGEIAAAMADIRKPDVQMDRGLLTAFVPPPLPPNIVDHGRMVFLFSKKLQNTDVSHVGRIILPKKPAEAHLPMLLKNESFILPMNDMNCVDQWSFKFRYWPNNRSRMYVLEGTGAFTKKHGLQTGDYMLLYLDSMYQNYLIRAVRANEVKGCANKEVSDLSGNNGHDPLVNDVDFVNENRFGPGGHEFEPFYLLDHPTNFPMVEDPTGVIPMDDNLCLCDLMDSFSSGGELMANFPATQWSTSFKSLSSHDLSRV